MTALMKMGGIAMEPFGVELLDKGPLTDREAEILRLVCEAKSDKHIARLLDISISTVEKHVEHIYSKLGVTHARLHRRLVVLRQALTGGLIRLLLLVLVAGAIDDHDDIARVGRARLRVQTMVRVRRFT